MFYKKLVERLMTEYARERDDWKQERQELLNRIARPEQIFTPVHEEEVVEPSKDETELAYVGGEVPDNFRAPDG